MLLYRSTTATAAITEEPDGQEAQHYPETGTPQKTAALLPKGYAELLGQLNERIRSAQLRASLAVNHEMVLLYWQIGRDILQRQEREGWGGR